MRQITRMTIATIGTAALLTGSGGVALAAHQSATTTATARTTAATTVTTTTVAAPASAAAISYSRALQIAKKRVPGARVTKAEREVEHGHRTWKFELRKGGWEYDVYVSTKTGKIIKFKSDHDDSGRHSGRDDSGHHGGGHD
ncbi:PepSY domain-containing protein [Streptosporangium lutulentum]|uniref:Membrane protein YkoI n=1 Tax=Streptosporangium lutulentum TaxID=1461250 RepID=A0ABT9QH63_9ACTN|nr:PepSY domain-containing protein [Streptosporangium lutulentum]MDP9845720.1 putative membrane protein YkoI [Streptosporangium lutulentum]